MSTSSSVHTPIGNTYLTSDEYFKILYCNRIYYLEFYSRQFSSEYNSSVLIYNLECFKNVPTTASFSFSFFLYTNFTEKIGGFSGIQTRIIGVEGKHTDHLNTLTALFTILECSNRRQTCQRQDLVVQNFDIFTSQFQRICPFH